MLHTKITTVEEHFFTISIDHSEGLNLFKYENMDRLIDPQIWKLVKVVEKAYKLGYENAGGTVYD